MAGGVVARKCQFCELLSLRGIAVLRGNMERTSAEPLYDPTYVNEPHLYASLDSITSKAANSMPYKVLRTHLYWVRKCLFITVVL